MAKAIKIDPTNKRVSEVDVSTLEDLQREVGGYITIAVRMGGDVLLVDEEGMYSGKSDVFKIEGSPHPYPYIGNGLIVSEELLDDNEEDVSISPQDLSGKIFFGKLKR